MSYVAFSLGLIIGIDIFVFRNSPEYIEQIVERSALAIRNIDHLAKPAAGLCRPYIRIDYIRDICKIARLFAIAVNDRRLSSVQGIDKTRDHARIHRRWILPRAEDIKITQRKSFQSVNAVKYLAIIFARQLRGRIWRERLRAHRLNLGQGWLIAVCGARCSVDESFYAAVSRFQ